MKQIVSLLIAAMLLAISPVNSQTDSSKLTVKQVYTDVKDGFKNLVTSLQGPAKHTYEVYVTQYRINGITNITVEFIITIILIILMALAFKSAKWEDDAPQNPSAILSIVWTIFFVISAGFLIADFSGNLQRAINPEYYAIREIIDQLTGQHNY